MENLARQLEAKGFKLWHTGGNCRAMARRRDGATDVVTDTGGACLPTESDWMLCTYAGQWEDDGFGEEPMDSLDSDVSPVSLLEAIALVK